ncbi:hypothetical protein V6N11_049202 [Hibiscus sabdariffa]|uniref:Uncharacterized protein n=1 Tax=Hibiscus sabdariffa TaxID=183260 RepID=A0ABR2NKL6_9ROSI
MLYNRLGSSSEPIWHGSNKSKLSIVSKLVHLKAQYRIPNACYDDICQIMQRLMSEDNVMLNNIYETKKLSRGLLYTGQFVDYFDNCDVDEMSIFEVKTLGSDKDVLEILSKLPRDHYVHVYLEEVKPYQNTASVEPNDEPSVEPNDEPSVEENFVEPETNDNVDEEHSVEVNIGEPSDDGNVEVNIGEPSDDGNVADSNSDSEDVDYEVSKSTSYESGFTDTENDLENESDSEGVGDNVTREESHRHNRKGSDEIMVYSDPESGHSDSFHSLDEAYSDDSHKKPRYPEFNTTTVISKSNF